ncbi:MAG: LytR/AlgR family response regulator transcription factor [Alloprevotella sp.]
MLKCIAIDDEPIALEIIRKYCEKKGGLLLETFSSPRPGLHRILEWQPDIVFLDIEMKGTSGLELAGRLPESTCLIFTTAYANYALDGFEANAVDFLHKPFFYERFERAVQKAQEWLRMRDLLAASGRAERCISVKSDYKTVAISADDIIYIEAVDNYVKFHLADGTAVLSKMPLYSVEEQLPEGEFLRIHRSFIVRESRIVSFTRSEITLSKNGKRLPVGKKYAEAVWQRVTGE